jgi:hypothetical protein
LNTVSNVGYSWGMQEAEFTIEVKNTRPIELLDLTASLTALANEYQRHLNRDHAEDAASEVRLYVKEIRSGSVIAELMAASPTIMQGLSYVNTVISFSTFLKKSYDFLTGKSEEKPAELDRKALEHLSQIVEPIAKDNGSQLIIGTVNGNVYYVTSAEANQAQNTVNRLLRDETTTATKYHEKVLLYWHQARNDARSTTGDKGIIESISELPVKVICMKESLKVEMILDIENPFKEAYIVDVAVETINGKPVVYKVMALYDKVPRE